MDKCSRHDTPLAISVDLTDWLGHDLALGLKVRGLSVLTSQWLSGKSL